MNQKLSCTELVQDFIIDAFEPKWETCTAYIYLTVVYLFILPYKYETHKAAVKAAWIPTIVTILKYKP